MASDANTNTSKSPSRSRSSSSSSSSDGWKQRITIPTLLAGLVGGAFGLASKRRRPLAATYAVNLAVVAGCYCGVRELARDARGSYPDDLVNSVIGGIASGALLGRLQGGRQLGAVRYAIIFATIGTAVDFATLQLRPYQSSLQDTAQHKLSSDSSWWSLPEWSPIQVLDEEALAAKKAREEQLYGQRRFGKLNEEKP